MSWQVQDLDSARRAAWDSDDYEATARLSADTIERLLGPLSGSILEIGCGPGRVTEELSRRHPSLVVIGVDSSEEMLSHAPESRVRYLLGDGCNIPRCGPVDAVYSHLVFQHLEPATVQGYLREIARVLRPSGRWMVQFVQGDCHDGLDHRYTVAQMESCAVAAGLRVDRAESAIYPEWVWMVGAND